MELLARFSGRNGEISIIEERATGARLYHEAGVDQSYVLPGGAAGVGYVRLMTRILEPANDVVLFGCGGGALATEHVRRLKIGFRLVSRQPIDAQLVSLLRSFLK